MRTGTRSEVETSRSVRRSSSIGRLRTARRLALAVCAASVLGVAGCGSDDADEASSAAQANGLTGEPIKVGMILDSSGTSGSYPQYRAGLNAAIEYVNSELKGAGGRPFQAEICASTGTPESAVKCANELVADKVTFVVGGVNVGGPAANNIIFRSGIPFIGGIATSPDMVQSDNAFFFWNGALSGIPSLFGYARQELDIDRLLLVTASNPIGVAAAKSYGTLFSAGGGDETKIVNHPFNVTDYSSIGSTIASSGFAAAALINPAVHCIGIGKALASQEADTTVLMGQACAGDEVTRAVPASQLAKSIWESPTLLPGVDDPDVEAYVAAMKRYGQEKYTGFFTASMLFQSVVNVKAIADRVHAAGEEITGESLVAELRKTKDEPSFMGHPYTCDGKQLQDARAICNIYERAAQYVDGSWKDLGVWTSWKDVKTDEAATTR